MIEARVCPEMFIILKCKEAAAFDRLIDRKAIEVEFNKLVKEREEAAKKKREEDRAAKVAELNESIVVDEDKTQADKDAEIAQAMAEWDEARDAEDAAAEEDDPEKPDKVAMEQVYREKIQAQREADEAFIEEFSNALKEKGILVIDDVKADTSADFVFVKLNSKLHNNFQMRNDLIERQQASVLTAKELPFYEQSY